MAEKLSAQEQQRWTEYREEAVKRLETEAQEMTREQLLPWAVKGLARRLDEQNNSADSKRDLMDSGKYPVVADLGAAARETREALILALMDLLPTMSKAKAAAARRAIASGAKVEELKALLQAAQAKADSNE